MSHRHGAAHRRFPWFGAALAALLAATALAGPALLTADPLEPDLMAAGLPPGGEWLLGTDPLGRSVLARTVAAARLSLGVALAASLATALLGTVVGLLTASLGGMPRRLLRGLTETVYACPALLLVLVATELLGGGVGTVLLGLVLTRWPPYAQLAEPLARGALAAPEAEASLLLGFGRAYRLRRHAWPAIARPVASLAALQLGGNLLTVSALGFLGIGLLPPRPEWGAMIAEALPYLQEAPHMLAAPAAAIFLATWSATLIGEGLARAPAPALPLEET
ncbi:ABC transporter permease [Teichococcus aestuarii]|uniref:ABC transporter permease n=1 Tax=Teichococcus aestuarii TaxID=568898 RepID=UPI00361D926E